MRRRLRRGCCMLCPAPLRASAISRASSVAKQARTKQGNGHAALSPPCYHGSNRICSLGGVREGATTWRGDETPLEAAGILGQRLAEYTWEDRGALVRIVLAHTAEQKRVASVSWGQRHVAVSLTVLDESCGVDHGSRQARAKEQGRPHTAQAGPDPLGDPSLEARPHDRGF